MMVERVLSLEGGYVAPGPIVQVGAVSVPITITLASLSLMQVTGQVQALFFIWLLARISIRQV